MHRADLVANFCGAHELLVLAQMGAEWRAVPRIAKACAILDDMLLSGDSDDPEYLELLYYDLCLAPISDPMNRPIDLAARAVAKFAETPGMYWEAVQLARSFDGGSAMKVLAQALMLGLVFSGNVYGIDFDIHVFHETLESIIFVIVSRIVSGKDKKGHHDLLDWIIAEMTPLPMDPMRGTITHCIVRAFACCLAYIPSYPAGGFIDRMSKNHPSARLEIKIRRNIYYVLADLGAFIGHLLRCDVFVNEVSASFEQVLIRKSMVKHIFAKCSYEQLFIVLGHPHTRIPTKLSTRINYILYAARNPDARVFECVRDLLWSRADVEYIAKNERVWWTYTFREVSIEIPWIPSLGLEVLQRMIARSDAMEIPLIFAAMKSLEHEAIIAPIRRAEMFACMREIIAHDKRVLIARGFDAQKVITRAIPESHRICRKYGTEMIELINGAV